MYQVLNIGLITTTILRKVDHSLEGTVNLSVPSWQRTNLENATIQSLLTA